MKKLNNTGMWEAETMSLSPLQSTPFFHHTSYTMPPCCRIPEAEEMTDLSCHFKVAVLTMLMKGLFFFDSKTEKS